MSRGCRKKLQILWIFCRDWTPSKPWIYHRLRYLEELQQYVNGNSNLGWVFWFLWLFHGKRYIPSTFLHWWVCSVFIFKSITTTSRVKRKIILKFLKGTVRVISIDSICKDGNVRFTTKPLNHLSDQKYWRYCRFFRVQSV